MLICIQMMFANVFAVGSLASSSGSSPALRCEGAWEQDYSILFHQLLAQQLRYTAPNKLQGIYSDIILHVPSVEMILYIPGSCVRMVHCQKQIGYFNHRLVTLVAD